MLYDELVPQGEYLAHYGVPKDQWSPEARARHNRNHPQKGDVPPIAYRQVYENLRGAYDEYQNNNYNRGGNRSTFGSKVDEHRAQAAEARRRNRRGAGYQTQSKPDDGQHTGSYRKPNKTETKSSLPNKPHSMPETTRGRSARIVERAFEIASDRYHNGKNSSSSSKPTPSSQSADQPIARNMRSGSDKGGRLGANAASSVNRKDRSPSIQSQRAVTAARNAVSELDRRARSGDNIRVSDYYHNGSLTKNSPALNNLRVNTDSEEWTRSFRNKRGKKSSNGKSSRKIHSKNAHSGGGYSDRANTNIYDRPTGNRTRHSGNAGPGSMEQIGDHTYRRVDYESRRRRR